MKKCVKKKAGILLFTLVIILAGCATTQHELVINNISPNNIKEIYIKNAGTANWGANMVKNVDNIDLSAFTNTVDIKVIDNNNTVYSKYNVSFNDAAFTESGTTSTMNTFVGVILLGGIITGLVMISGK
ncbi:MAG: hypothetical protein FWD78_08650 [Treponema sp.]|nr:hypothetical protein [Treponema sp.]